MSVVNLELAKNVTLNGRLPNDPKDPDAGSRVVSVTLIPGLNNVTPEQMEMLERNDSFEYHLSVKEVSIVSHSESPKDAPPEDIEDIDITEMNVSDAATVINSAATVALLDKFEEQENSLETPRKGVLAALKKQRKAVGEVIAKHENA